MKLLIRKSSLLISFLTMILSINLNAQQDTSRAPLQSITFHNHNYYVNNTKLDFQNQKQYLTKFPKANAEYKKLRLRNSFAYVAILTGITSGILALINIKKEHEFFNPYTITMLGSFGLLLPIGHSAIKHENKSVCYYNIELMKAKGY